MTFYGQQFMYLADPFGSPMEIVNGARTMSNMSNASLCGSGIFTNPIANGGCDVLLLEPCVRTDNVIPFPTRIGANSSNLSGTSLAITLTDAVAVGDILLVYVATDNLSATTPTFTIADVANNSFVSLAQAARNATGAAGVAAGLFYLACRNPIAAATVVTITMSGAVVGKAAQIDRYTGVGMPRVVVTTNDASTTPSVSVTDANAKTRDLFVAMLAAETSVIALGDTSAYQGSWRAVEATASAGVADAGVQVARQSKYLTADGAQTWQGSITSTDWIAFGVTLPYAPRSVTSTSWQPLQFESPLDSVPAVLAEAVFWLDAELSTYTWSELATEPDAAPWFNSSSAASTEAIGFLIEEWTGLDGAAFVRSATGIGGRQGGARFGPLSSKHRVMKINVLLHGSSERGLNYLFRWLEQRLIDCCNPEGGQSVWWRDSCPNVSTPEYGLRRLDRVALIEGPTWEAQPTYDSGCYVRRVSFTLAAGDPCVYDVDTNIVAPTTATTSGVTLSSNLFVADRNFWVGTGDQIVASMPAPEVGKVAPIVTITSSRESRSSGVIKPLPDLRIVGYADPQQYGTNFANMMKIGELLIAGTQTSGLEIKIDMAARRVTYRDPYGSDRYTWYDASRLIRANLDGTITNRWFAFDGCFEGVVVIEPVFTGWACSYEPSTADPVSAFTVTVDAVEFNGCC